MLSFIPHSQDRWEAIQFEGHKAGITCLSWAPYIIKKSEHAILGQQASSAEERKEEPLPMRFATGGTDGLVKYWTYNAETGNFAGEVLFTRSEWIKDLAFADHNSMGLNISGYSCIDDLYDTLAVCSEKEGVLVLTKNEENWEEYKLPTYKAAPLKLSWGMDGNCLVVMYDDGASIIYEEKDKGKWEEVVEEKPKEELKK